MRNYQLPLFSTKKYRVKGNPFKDLTKVPYMDVPEPVIESLELQIMAGQGILPGMWVTIIERWVEEYKPQGQS